MKILFYVSFEKNSIIINARATTFSTICLRGKLWVVELWTHHFYFTTHNLPREHIV